MEASTYIEEGAGVLQHQLAGVGFILTVIHIDMELISLQEERRGEDEGGEQGRKEGCGLGFSSPLFLTWCEADSHPGDEAVTDVFRQLLVVYQLLQENTAGTHRDAANSEDGKHKDLQRYQEDGGVVGSSSSSPTDQEW